MDDDMSTLHRRQYPPFSQPVYAVPKVLIFVSVLAWVAIIVLWMAVLS
jgi:hypothetical protein